MLSEVDKAGFRFGVGFKYIPANSEQPGECRPHSPVRSSHPASLFRTSRHASASLRPILPLSRPSFCLFHPVAYTGLSRTATPPSEKSSGARPPAPPPMTVPPFLFPSAHGRYRLRPVL